MTRWGRTMRGEKEERKGDDKAVVHKTSTDQPWERKHNKKSTFFEDSSINKEESVAGEGGDSNGLADQPLVETKVPSTKSFFGKLLKASTSNPSHLFWRRSWTSSNTKQRRGRQTRAPRRIGSWLGSRRSLAAVLAADEPIPPRTPRGD